MNINLTAAQLRRAADIKDQITKLEGAFDDVINGHIPVQSTVVDDGWPLKPKASAWTPERTRKFKRTMRLKRQGLK